LKAGHEFICVCCSEGHPEEEGVLDEQLGGPVCPECKKNIKGALAEMKNAWKCPIRPMEKSDLNPSNFKRFIT
jgi:hypothetical protein